VIGRIVKFHVLEDVLSDSSRNSLKPVVDWDKLKPIGRMGGDLFTAVCNSIEIKRPINEKK
jgi:flavin reductase (DIM6/NTAB) family NADH-FMN oxidoreductase RutF